MIELKGILERLKQPSVLISIAAQIATILALFNINADMNEVSGVIAAVSSVFVLLGIVSDPTTRNKGYGDDMRACHHCGRVTSHVMIDGSMVCRGCGSIRVKKEA